MRIITALSFARSVDRLDTQSQILIKTAVMDLQFDLMRDGQPRHGLRVHKLKRVRDPGIMSISPDKDLRIIVHRHAQDYTLLYADHHDDAYEWASRRRPEVNPESGVMQVVEELERTEVITRFITQTMPYAFNHYEAPYLMSLGVPPSYVDAVRHATVDNVDALFEVLPDEASERLLDLMDGKLVMPPAPVVSGDPFDHPDARRYFHVITGEADLEAALSGRWEEWMVYLHPSQRQLVEKTFGGPARVSGSAGTGKTVVALHRAAELARRDSGAVLLTCFSRTLADSLAEKLTQLLPDPEERARVTVLNLHRLSLRLAPQLGLGTPKIHPGDLEPLFRKVLSQFGSAVSLAFLMSEWRNVIEPRGLTTWDAYRSAPRVGRGVALGARQRRAIWTVVEAALEELKRQGGTTWGLLGHQVAEALEQQEPRFQHVITDEAQDLGPAELRLLRALAAPGPDDLMLCGDAGQRVYRGRSSWLAMGVDVRGRSSHLKINYRTSQDIRQFADRLMPAQLADEEGEPESRRTLSRFRGMAPEVQRFGTQTDQVRGVAFWVQARLAEGLRPGEVAVLTRTQPGRRAESLSQACSTPVQTLEHQVSPDPEQLVVTTMHRAKGLEFRAVVLMDLGDEQMPLKSLMTQLEDPADREAAFEQERQLLYVAATRAREALFISYVGEPSPWITP